MVVILAALLVTIIVICGVFHQRIRAFFKRTIPSTPLPSGPTINPQNDEGISNNPERAEPEPLSPYSPLPTSSGFEFDVFLNFRGEDTRKGFTGHLYQGLQLPGVSVFIDSEKLEKGRKIDRLFDYVERCRICVAIFSKGYSDSTWCLQEIAKMVEFGKLILPVFFGVEPSDVRNQSGPFAAAFERHEADGKLNQEEVSKWRDALKIVGNISGYTLKDTDGYEATLILLIVKRVLSELNMTPLEVAKHPIGIDARVNDVKNLLKIGKENVHMIGIQGLGGIGKTTIAKAIYNDLFLKFEGSTFISNIREKFLQHGELKLQEQLISEILKDKCSSIYSIDQGKNLIKNRINSKRVLIVLDDVDHIDQLRTLVGGRDWLGSGSIVFVTTRDENVLKEHDIHDDQIYKVEALNYDQSLELFKRHAFKSKQPKEEFIELADKFVTASGGLPLALEIFGSLLSWKRDVQEWKSTLMKLQKIPQKDIQQRLMISYDGLEKEEKQIFLDISCFFIGHDRIRATYMWDACGLFPETAIQVLRSKSLINVDGGGEFVMHDLVRDMGHDIVRQESTSQPWKRSRLWNSDDIFDILQKKVSQNIDAEMIEILEGNGRCLSTQCFENMPNLRFLDVGGVNFQDRFKQFPTELKWLRLRDCHFELPPSDFNLERVAILDISGSNMGQVLINHVPPRGMAFDKLKILVLSWTPIKMTPDFTNMPYLVKLTLEGCTMLTVVHESIGKLKNLAYLDLSLCTMLCHLPETICRLSSLKILFLGGFVKNFYVPEQLWYMRSRIYLTKAREIYKNEDPGIVRIPNSIGLLTNLHELSLVDCRRLTVLPNSICQLSSLTFLDLEGCHKLAFLPERLGDMKSLKRLLLSGTIIKSIPDSIGQLTNLHELVLIGCRCLRMLPDSICQLNSLELLYVQFCSKLFSLPKRLGDMKSLKVLMLDGTIIETIPDSIGDLTNLRELSLASCKCLKFLPDSICQLSSLQMLVLQKCSKLSSLPERLGDMKSLVELQLDWTCIESIPDSVGQLTNLYVLSLEGCKYLEMLPDSLRILQQLGRSETNPKELASDMSDPTAVSVLEVSSCLSPALLDSSCRTIKELCLSDPTVEELPDSMGQLENLEMLSLQCNKIRALPDWIGWKWEKLTSLKICSMNLKALPNWIGSLTGLMKLKIECVNLEAVPDSIEELKELMTFEVQSNILKALPDSIGSMRRIQQLELVCGNIEALPDSIGGLESLETLRIKSESLNALPDTMGSLRKVEILVLECMNLEVLPDSIGEMKELMVIEVKSNILAALPDSIGSLTNVKELKLECENLEALPDSLGRLESLEVLKVKSECLEALTDSVGSLQKLAELVLECVNLEALPDSIGQLKALAIFKVQSHSLAALPDSIGSMEWMEELKLECVYLDALPDSFGGFQNLETLKIISESLEALPDSIGSLKRLVTLEVQSDALTTLPNSIGLLELVEDLKLECVNLEALPDSFGGLKSLKTLDVWSENLKAFPDSIVTLEWVEKLVIECMNLEALPDSIGGLKRLETLEIMSESLKALPDSIGTLEWVERLAIDCMNLEALPNSVGRLKRLKTLELKAESLRALPDSLGTLERVETLVLECVNLEALPDSIGELKNLQKLECICDNLTALPDCISRLANLKKLSLKSNNLKELNVSDGSLGSLEELSLKGCQNLDDLSAGLAHLPSLMTLILTFCKRLEFLPQLPPSLAYLYAHGSTCLRTISDLSNLTLLKSLSLGKCHLLEDVPGLETIAGNLTSLILPSPFGSSCLSDDFMNRVLKAATFENLRVFCATSDILERGSAVGQKQLSFMLPKVPTRELRRAALRFGEFDQFSSPIYIAIVAQDRVVFETTRVVKGTRLAFDDELITHARQGCHMMQVTADMAEVTRFDAYFEWEGIENDSNPYDTLF